MTPSRGRELPHALGAAALLTAAVFVLDRLCSTYLRDPSAPTSAWWPPAAVGFAIVVFAPRSRRAPGLALAALANFLAYHHGTLTPAHVAFFAVVNVADGGLAGAIFLRLNRRRRPDQPISLLRDPLDTVRLVIACSCGAVAAAFVVACQRMYQGGDGVLDLTRSYLTAHLVGLAVITPGLLLAPRTVAAWREQVGGARRNLEWALHLAIAGGLCAWLFFGSAQPGELPFVAVPMLIAAARLEPLRAMSVVAVYCALATTGTVNGHGAIGTIADPTARQWALQFVVGAGAVLALYVTLTARARASADLRARTAERLVTHAFEATPQPMCVTSLDVERHGEILQVNQALCDLLWRTSDALIGCSSRTLVTTPPSVEAAALSRDMIAGQIDRHRIERDMIRSDGTTIPVIQDIAVVRPEEGPPCLVVAITDLRPDRAAQAMLLDALRSEADAAVNLRRAAEARKALAARTTHDLRTPLMSVQGYLDLVLDDDRVEHDQRALLDIAVRNTGRVLELVDDLVTIAGLESAEAPGTSEPQRTRHVTLDSVVDIALESITPMCARKSQRLVRPEAPTGVLVDGERMMLERALLNVLSNASKYTPEGGTVTIGTVTDGAQVSVTVTDTGIGVAADDLPHVGEQFFRAGTARDHSIPGTGLGLAITRAVLERLDGSLELSSMPHEGTTVTMTLPVLARRFEAVAVHSRAEPVAG